MARVFTSDLNLNLTIRTYNLTYIVMLFIYSFVELRTFKAYC